MERQILLPIFRFLSRPSLRWPIRHNSANAGLQSRKSECRILAPPSLKVAILMTKLVQVYRTCPRPLKQCVPLHRDSELDLSPRQMRLFPRLQSLDPIVTARVVGCDFGFDCVSIDMRYLPCTAFTQPGTCRYLRVRAYPFFSTNLYLFQIFKIYPSFVAQVSNIKRLMLSF